MTCTGEISGTNITTISGATVTNKNDIITVSGAALVISGALVTDIANLVTVSGANYAGSVSLLAVSGADYGHRNDNSQAHSDYLLNTGADEAVGPLTVTADNSTRNQAYIPMVLYDSGATPPNASGVPIGTLFIQYTA